MKFSGFEVSEQLCFMNSREALNRLDLNDKPLIDQKIKSILPHTAALVTDFHSHLAGKWDC